jgi:8-oxo-dGTP diphosphatase
MIDVTCAIIRNEDNEVLIVQRGVKSDHPFKWEFPGGKTAPGETNEECIIREIAEELSISIVICGHLTPVEYNYGIREIRLIPFICDTLDEFPLLSEHNAYKWIEAKELTHTDFSEADVPVAREYLVSVESVSGKAAAPGDEKPLNQVNDAELQEMINSIMRTREVDWIANSAADNQVIFLKLLEYSYRGDKKLAFRASWIVSKVCDQYPEKIYPFLPDIIESLPQLENESVERSFLRILSLSDIEALSPRHQGLLADYSFTALNSPESAIAIKAYTMEILYKLSVIYPELGNELAASIRIVMEDGSAGIVARGTMILRKITGISLDRKSSQK